MRIQELPTSSAGLISSAVLVVCLASAFAGAWNVPARQEKRQKTVRAAGESLEINEFTLIPEANEPCTQEEAAWWARLRAAGNELIKKNNEKSKNKFYLLLLEGQQKAYRVPLKDAPPHSLVVGRLVYPERARMMGRQGTLVMSVEFKADASLGEIEIINGLVPELNESGVQSVRQSVFLPAIKDGVFVSARTEVKCEFNLGGMQSKRKP